MTSTLQPAVRQRGATGPWLAAIGWGLFIALMMAAIGYFARLVMIDARDGELTETVKRYGVALPQWAALVVVVLGLVLIIIKAVRDVKNADGARGPVGLIRLPEGLELVSTVVPSATLFIARGEPVQVDARVYAHRQAWYPLHCLIISTPRRSAEFPLDGGMRGFSELFLSS